MRLRVDPRCGHDYVGLAQARPNNMIITNHFVDFLLRLAPLMIIMHLSSISQEVESNWLTMRARLGVATNIRSMQRPRGLRCLEAAGPWAVVYMYSPSEYATIRALHEA